MFIFPSQKIASGYFFLFFITVNLTFVPLDSTTPETELSGDNPDCAEFYNRNGSYTLKIKEDCDVYYLNLDFEINTSIINLTTSISHLDQNQEWEGDLKSTFNITLEEMTESMNSIRGQKILLKKWDENTDTLPCVENYLSRSSKVFLTISGTGDWSHYKIKFSFKEIKYNLIPVKPTNGKETITYRPNSVTLLSFSEPQEAWRGIEISFDSISINTEMGEYILIGAGTEPFKNEHSLPLYITQVAENSTFFVDDSSAFVAFVSGSLQNTDASKDFTIIWKRIKDEPDTVTEDPMGVLNSSLICFYNYSEAIKEFKKKDKNTRFETFRQYFLEIAKAYFPENKVSKDLNTGSIDLFGLPTKQNFDGSDVLSILIRVKLKGMSIFTWRQLQIIIEKFEENSTRILGYKAGKCPQIAQYDLPYKDDWGFVIYALIPVFGLFALMMWAWKQNLFAQNCLTEKEEKMSFDHVHADPNLYGTTPPKIRCDEGGRGDTLIQGSMQQDDGDGAIDTTMVEMNVIPSSSQEQDTLTRYLSSRRSKSRPSLKSLLDNVEEINKLAQSGKTEGNESDHLYDSVYISNQLDDTKL